MGPAEPLAVNSISAKGFEALSQPAGGVDLFARGVNFFLIFFQYSYKMIHGYDFASWRLA